MTRRITLADKRAVTVRDPRPMARVISFITRRPVTYETALSGTAVVEIDDDAAEPTAMLATNSHGDPTIRIKGRVLKLVHVRIHEVGDLS